MTFIEVKLAQLFAIIIQLVWIIIVFARKEAPPLRLLSDDDAFQARIRKSLIANEIDFTNTRRAAFIDFKDQIDAVRRQHLNLGHDIGRKLARPAIDFLHPTNVCLHTVLRKP